MLPPQLKPRQVSFGRAVRDRIALGANPEDMHEETTVTVAECIPWSKLKFNHGTHARLLEATALLASPTTHLGDTVDDVENKEKGTASSHEKRLVIN